MCRIVPRDIARLVPLLRFHPLSLHGSEARNVLNQSLPTTAGSHANPHDRPHLAPSHQAIESTDATTPTLAEENGEISIEAYMTALLDRVRNKTDGLAPRESADASSPKKAARAPSEPVAPESPASCEPQSAVCAPGAPSAEQSPGPSSLADPPFRLPTPRRDLLEQLDLAVMRELAQSHAVATIDKHFRRQSLLAAGRQAAIVLAALTVGIVLAHYSQAAPMAHVPCIVSFATAILWALHCAQSMLSVSHGSSRTRLGTATQPVRPLD